MIWVSQMQQFGSHIWFLPHSSHYYIASLESLYWSQHQHLSRTYEHSYTHSHRIFIFIKLFDLFVLFIYWKFIFWFRLGLGFSLFFFYDQKQLFWNYWYPERFWMRIMNCVRQYDNRFFISFSLILWICSFDENRILSLRIILYHIISYHIMSYRIILYHIIKFHY